LAVLPRLETFHFHFQSATPLSDRMRPPPVTRTILPVLTTFQFRGVDEYLEDLVAQIDSPQLNRIVTVYLNRPVVFQVAQLSTFVHRSVGPFRCAYIRFDSDWVTFTFYRHAYYPGWNRHPVGTTLLSKVLDWHVASHMAQVLSQFSVTLSNVVHLKLEVHLNIKLVRQLMDAGYLEWLHLLRQFSTVQTLHVSQKFSRFVALVLEDITAEMAVEVLPSLHLIFLEDQPTFTIENFITFRQLCGRPVTAVETVMDYERLILHQ